MIISNDKNKWAEAYSEDLKKFIEQKENHTLQINQFLMQEYGKYFSVVIKCRKAEEIYNPIFAQVQKSTLCI